MLAVLQVWPLEVLAGVVDVLDHVALGVLLHQPQDLLHAVQGRGGATSLENYPPLGDEEGALGQHIGIYLRVSKVGNNLTLGQY